MSLANADRVVLVVERLTTDDRAEDLLRSHAVGRGTGANTVGGNQKPGPSGALPRNATGDASVHIGRDRVAVGRGDQRAHFARLGSAGSADPRPAPPVRAAP